MPYKSSAPIYMLQLRIYNNLILYEFLPSKKKHYKIFHNINRTVTSLSYRLAHCLDHIVSFYDICILAKKKKKYFARERLPRHIT